MKFEDFSPEQQAFIQTYAKENVSLEPDTIQNFVKEKGGRYFASSEAFDNELSRLREETRNATVGSTYEALEGFTQELTGIPKKEGEKYRDYLKRAYQEKITASSKGGEESFKELLSTKDKELLKLRGELEKMQATVRERELSLEFSQAFDELQLDYEGNVLRDVQSGIKARFLDTFEIRDGRVYEKGTDKPVLNPTTNDYTTVKEAFLKFGLSQGYKVKEAQRGANLPNTQGSGGSSEEQIRAIQEQVDKIARDKGLPKNKKEYWVLAKSKGLPIPARVTAVWPDLK